ncbi:MAG: multicopper oxidase domain-containing protein, partial [Pseudomonas aeruginosa]|nr:multicopper oxidase domain-containing protein [Pseudomonas aeruginosa]
MRLFRCLALLLSLAAPAAFAGGPYQVELVVFRQAGDAVPSSQPAPDDWATGAQPLASDALRATALDNQLAKLSQDNGYTVLLHKAWRQDIGETPVNLSGSPATAMTINGSLPGPTLRWREGDNVTLRVRNRLAEDTSIHWHGIILPANMDGVPGLSFEGIAPGGLYEYRFKVRQNGTYWYHSHS